MAVPYDARVSSERNGVRIGKDLWVSWYRDPASPVGHRPRQWLIGSMYTGTELRLTYQQMCELRHWFRDPGEDVPPFLPEAAAAA